MESQGARYPVSQLICKTVHPKGCSFLKCLFFCRISIPHQDQPLFHLLDLQEPPVTSCSLWLPEPGLRCPQFIAFYSSSSWPHRCHLYPMPLNTCCFGMSGKWENDATKLRGKMLFPGIVSFLTSYLLPAQSDPGPGEEFDKERKWPHSAWLWAILRIRCSPLSQGRRKGSGKEDTGWGSGRTRVKCTMSLQLGWHSKRLTCGNWAFAFKISSPGNIFFDGCTSIKKHDDPNDRRRDEEGCI